MVMGSTFQSRASSSMWVRVVPVAEAGEVAVGAALAGVLGGGLAVHLQHPAPRPARHAPQQVEVVDLAGGRGGLVGLVDALEDGGQQPLGRAQDPGRLADLAGGDAADLGRPLRRPVGHCPLRLLEPVGVGRHPVAVDMTTHEQLVLEGVEEGQVGAAAHGQAQVGLAGGRGRPRVDHHQGGRARPAAAVQHPRHSTVWVAATLWPTRKRVSAASTSV
jgi:hypothetical protein